MELCRRFGHVTSALSIALLGLSIAGAAACGKHHPNPGDDVDGSTYVPDACEGLICFQVNCTASGKPPTTVSGTVYAPNGTLPLFGVNVYVPASDPGPLHEGVQCDHCQSSYPGGALAATITDEAGHFSIENVPATSDVPLVIQVGKWRRQLVLPAVAACQDTPLPDTMTTLPKDKSEGDIPQIAITTGDADALECLVRKLGIADSEFTNKSIANPVDPLDGRVHLYAGNGANKFKAGFPGGSGPFQDANKALDANPDDASSGLWNDPVQLARYDIVLFSCEGAQYPGTKSQIAMNNVKAYADLGGRVFMSHWHNIWIGGEDGNLAHGIPSWESVGTFDYNAPQDLDDTTASVDETVAKGVAFATWLVNVGASTVRDQVPIHGARYTLPSNDPLKSDRRVYIDPALVANHVSVQDLQFTTPNDVPEAERCGKVVFSDMHVSSGSSSHAANPFPGTGMPDNGCDTGPLSPQEKALAFIFFDIASCVGIVQ